MGQQKHDGRATQNGVTVPGATAIVFGDLYRIDGFTGFALKAVGASDTLRVIDLEIDKMRVWEVKLPAALNPAKGDFLYWTAGAGFKRGDTDLTATVTGAAVCKVEATKDGNGYAAVQLTGLG